MSKNSRRVIVSVVSLIVVAAIVVVGLKVLAARKTAAAVSYTHLTLPTKRIV